MYAIFIDLDHHTVECTHQNEESADPEIAIRSVLVDDFDFAWQQGGLYFGHSSVDPVTCILAVQELTRRFDWFAASAKTIRLLRINENTDLTRVTKTLNKISL